MLYINSRKSLKIPQGNPSSQFEEGETTPWSNGKRTKGQTTIYKRYT